MQHTTQMADLSLWQPEAALDGLLQLCFTLYTEHLLGFEAGLSASEIQSVLPNTPLVSDIPFCLSDSEM